MIIMIKTKGFTHLKRSFKTVKNDNQRSDMRKDGKSDAESGDESYKTMKKIAINCNDNPLPSLTSHYFTTASRLSSQFFADIPCIELAKRLLGQVLCRKLPETGVILKGKIVETESYLGIDDAACQTYGGRRTPRNEPMYMSPGTCYVYFTYGMYHCFNISAYGEGMAVLIRALEPIEGIPQMRLLRHAALTKHHTHDGQCAECGHKYKPLQLKELANGPAKLCIAMDINRFNINKLDITDCDDIWLEAGDAIDMESVVIGKRIGIRRAGEWNDKPLRYYIRNCQYVSIRDKNAEQNQ